MNKQPVSYLQTDSRWKALPYRVPGETATIGGSGCGPTAAAMAIESITGKTCTPVDTCKWSVDHGYKALNQGTYYAYFVPQFKAFGIDCKQMLGGSLHNNPTHQVHDQVKDYLSKGYYVIALMGPGTWTKGGHFILLWAWDDKVHINDPASTAPARLNGDPNAFKKEVKQYWLIDAREHNKEEEEVTYDQWKAFMEQYRKELSQQPPADWAQKTGEWDKAEEDGLVAKGAGRPQDLATRCEVAAMILRSQKN